MNIAPADSRMFGYTYSNGDRIAEVVRAYAGRWFVDYYVGTVDGGKRMARGIGGTYGNWVPAATAKAMARRFVLATRGELCLCARGRRADCPDHGWPEN